MADVFKKTDTISLLKGKHIVFIGDSNIRALYKDLVWLYRFNTLIGLSFLKRRLEDSFLGDKLVFRSELTRGRDFTEHRILKDKGTTIEFLFVTRCYCSNVIDLFSAIKDGTKHCPDVILMNSCLWDVSRWGPNGVNEYKANMEKLMRLLKSSLPKHVLFVWATALPTAALTSGGLLIKEIDFMQAVLRIHVIEANAFTAALVSSHGYDVLDFHHYLRYQIIRRSADGIHFLPPAVRFLTNLLLTHIALSWDVKLPRNLKTFTSSLAMKIKQALEVSSSNEVKQMFKKIELLADRLNKRDAGTSMRKKRKKRKQANKMKNIQIRKENKKVDYRKMQLQMPNEEREHLKTPPYYQKASVVGNNTRVTTGQNYSDFRNSQYPLKDFRLVGFNDFSQNVSPPSLFNYVNYPSYYQESYVNNNYGYNDGEYMAQNNMLAVGNLDNEYPSYNYYDRFSNYHNHPYKLYQVDDWQGSYRETYPYNTGPIRQSRYYSGRQRFSRHY